MAIAHPPRGPVRKILPIFLLAVSLQGAARSSTRTAPSVLILNSYHPGHIWTDQETDGELDILRRFDPFIDPYVEYLDWKRFPSPENISRMEEHIASKYAGQRLDLVMVNDNAALLFMLRNRARFAPAVPVVFAGINGLHALKDSLPRDVIGVAEAADHAATLTTALRLHPDARRVIIITDKTESGQGTRQEVESVLGRFAERAQFEFTDSMDMPRIISHLREVPRTSLVYLLYYHRDPSGKYYSHKQSVEIIAGSCPVPVYHSYDFGLGLGIVGGHLLSARSHGAAAGEIAARILKGERPEAVGIMEVSPCPPAFDNRQLQRFGIRPSQLPPEALVINQPGEFFERYRRFIVTAAIAILILAALNIALIINIRRRRQAEDSLRQSENRYRLLSSITIDAGVSGTIAADGTLAPEWVHQGSGIDYGYRFEEINSPEKWNAVTHPDDRHLLLEMYEKVRGGSAGAAEVRIFTRTGDVRWISHTISPLPRKEGEPVRIVGALKDITERKTAEESRRQLEEQLSQAQKMEAIGRVSGGIAHDINNLLVPILLNADSMLINDDASNFIKRDAEEIRSAALRARDMIKHLLAFSREQVFVMREGDLSTIVRDFERILRRTSREDIRIDLLLCEDPLPVRADPSRFCQVLLNLAINSQDAMPSGGVLTIRTLACSDPSKLCPDAVSELPQGPCALMTVEDTGTGMDEETRSKVFEPFFTTKEQGKGTGLGLATVYGIIKQHKGGIHVQSCKGAGTLFSVFLPLGAGPARRPVAGGPESLVSIPDLPAITIAVAEDDDAVRRVVTRVLTKVGFKVIEASGAQECLAALKNTDLPVQLLISDVIMPEMNGRDLYESLRAQRPDLNVIFMSGYSRDVLEQQDAFHKGAGYLAKPFETDTLLRLVREILTKP